MKRIAMAASLCLILLPVAGTLSAGPLDRQNAQQRSNPVTQSMIRVPGVVGQEQGQAMMSIQAAGLNVSVREAKKVPKRMGGAAGLEGKVIEQTPTAGGMAMYGTTVTLYVWKPGQAAAAGAAGTAAGTTSWGAGASPSYTGTSQPSYMGSPSGAAMQPSYGTGSTMGMGGTQMQGGQGFQVQQYYYPDGSGAGVPAQQGSTQAPQQQTTQPPPADPYGGQQGAAPPGGQAQPQTIPPGP